MADETTASSTTASPSTAAQPSAAPSVPLTKPDYVNVQLTPYGQEVAGAHPITISTGRRSFVLNGNNPLKVERSYEWKGLLSKVERDGNPLVQLVPDAAAS
jgi:hypothetical protein